MKNNLRTQNTKIVDSSGNPVYLHGLNLGGWLNMEGYILHGRNIPAQTFKKNFARHLGPKALADFEEAYYGSFIREDDFKKIAELGFNCLRVPFHYGLIENKAFQYKGKGLKLLDQTLAWGAKYKLWIILDLHAAMGSQNHDWHSDSLGEALLWTTLRNQERTYELWKFLADRYKDASYLAGYDLLNEVVLDDSKLLNRFYKKLIKSIREVDSRGILFVEGNRWGQDLDHLERFEDSNYALSIHNYAPLEFSHNLIPELVYPAPTFGYQETYNLLHKYQKIAQERGVPIFLGEFGVNARMGLFGEDKWLEDNLKCCQDFGFHWTYWTYKAVKNGTFPDGVFSYRPNPPWVNRLGPLMGWESYHLHWKKNKKDIIDSWDTRHYPENQPILSILQKYA